MEIDEATMMFNQIFQPGLIEESMSIVSEQKRFVYYTSADTAMKVLRNQELWFRNSTVMNDYSEITYGLGLIREVFSGEEGKRFRTSIEDIFPGTIKKAEEFLAGWERDWEFETYIACVSVHNPDEDQRGRLSMWRAYGDTALVINNTPMTATTDLLGVFSVPVLYLSERGLSDYLSQITDAILINRTYLQGLGQEILVGYIHQMLFRFAIATKHPGFAEEKEWRLFFRPTERTSPGMTEETVVLGGVPQKIYKLRLANEPENGLHGADIPSLLDRIIIGPTEFPYVSYQAFAGVLSELGVEDAAAKVVLSDIPLRTR
ncbi:DUF2971 domain-containing protein [Aliiroseovarius crassostreae]|uniref:DUF2971 domain-containing protein n=1 Tax=Aliiroseovarius crassostreae TaxID=154981 RepID=UPI002202A862|nr:DUF2971 domain-containing protein [Aliiroseovarius crassostreae]UWQ03968.1 DUF2971 domain-containing protein [Aliiroseovarius crassostreae]